MDIPMVQAGFWSVLPPLIAITLALIFKEVYSSLLIGTLSGMIIYSIAAGEPLFTAIPHLFDMMAVKIADNSYMILFLALLWSVVVLVSRSGGSEAYGRYVGRRLKSRRAASLSAVLLGILIFIDDGFNCLTVGTVMQPIFDRHRISREKLAYIIDATAAPVCIIAPVSSWAVAVASELSETDGFSLFLKAIPYNLYALLTLAAVLWLCLGGKDFGPMKKAEEAAAGSAAGSANAEEADAAGKKGKVIDLVLPIAVLIVCAIGGMAYVGGFFEGVPFSAAIGENPTAGLTLGAFGGLLTALLLYLPRRLMKPREFVDAIVEGVKNIVPPMLILILSWSLGGVCREMIGTGQYISGLLDGESLPYSLLPFLLFVIAAAMSFSMGTSWGTFGILIPLVSMICASGDAAAFLVPALGATLAGSVFGDHCSPLSDTTILASIGAQCEHLRHVETQLPYALLIAGISAAGYLIAGFTNGPLIPLIASFILLGAALAAAGRKKA